MILFGREIDTMQEKSAGWKIMVAIVGWDVLYIAKFINNLDTFFDKFEEKMLE